MKKLIYRVLFLSIVGIGIVGCKKEIPPISSKESNQSLISKSQSPASTYQVTNGMLTFNSVDDFDRLIESLNDDSYDELKNLDYK